MAQQQADQVAQVPPQQAHSEILGGSITKPKRTFFALKKAMAGFAQRDILCEEHQPLCAAISAVLEDWARVWGDDSNMKSFLNKKNLEKEIDE
jgi:hypothetical protein